MHTAISATSAFLCFAHMASACCRPSPRCSLLKVGGCPTLRPVRWGLPLRRSSSSGRCIDLLARPRASPRSWSHDRALGHGMHDSRPADSRQPQWLQSWQQSTSGEASPHTGVASPPLWVHCYVCRAVGKLLPTGGVVVPAWKTCQMALLRPARAAANWGGECPCGVPKWDPQAALARGRTARHVRVADTVLVAASAPDCAGAATSSIHVTLPDRRRQLRRCRANTCTRLAAGPAQHTLGGARQTRA